MGEKFLPLAIKYRPRALDDFVGHEEFVLAIKNAILNDRIHHAFLFTGTRGIGKTTIARILALTLNCSENKNHETKKFNSCDPCLKCESCLSILNGSSVDVLEIDAASNTGVDFIRQITEDATFGSFSGFYKIFIIDEVHMLSKSAFNALLKTLEEPPKNVKFIFATTEMNKIPITILSRCQKFYLRNMDYKVIKSNLERVCSLEDYIFEEEALKIIAVQAKGSMRDGLSLLEQVILNTSNKKITIQDIKLIIPILSTAELFYNLYLGNFEKSIQIVEANDFICDAQKLVEKILENIVDASSFVQKINSEYIQDNFLELLKKLSESELLNIPKLVRMWQVVSASLNEMKNIDEKLFIRMLFTKICYSSNLPTPIEIIKIASDPKLQQLKEQIPNSQIVS